MLKRLFKKTYYKIFQRRIVIYPQIKLGKMDSMFNGKTIIVTGGGSGIGFEIAKKIRGEGGGVIITGRDEEKLIKASQTIKCHYRVLDVSKIEAFDDFLKNIIENFGKIDGIVNNAGISLHENNIFEVTLESWDKQFNTNLKGPYFLTQKLIRYFLDTQIRGNILFISSETGDTCDIRPYGFTKAAVNSMVQGLAYRYKLDNIRVNAIAPGITSSDMTGVGKDGNYYAGTYGEGRYYMPEEIAEVAAFLLSDMSNCISGQIITCNNAQTVNARWKK